MTRGDGSPGSMTMLGPPARRRSCRLTACVVSFYTAAPALLRISAAAPTPALDRNRVTIQAAHLHDSSADN